MAISGAGQDRSNPGDNIAGSDSEAKAASDITTPGVPIKLVDPHPNLPNQILPWKISNLGVIVGHIGDEHDGTGVVRDRNGEYTEFVSPDQCSFLDSPCTYATGVNDRGQIVGYAVLQGGTKGFLREKSGALRTLPASPADSAPIPNAINNQDEIVGSYDGQDSTMTHGFLLRRGRYTTIDFPGTSSTYCTGINNSGLITGYYLEGDVAHGFLWWHGNFIATFQVSDSNGAYSTFPMSVNDRGQVAGPFGTPRGGGFVRNFDATINILDLATLLQPIGGSTGGTVNGINNRGDLVGYFVPSPFVIYGFLIPRGAGKQQ